MLAIYAFCAFTFLYYLIKTGVADWPDFIRDLGLKESDEKIGVATYGEDLDRLRGSRELAQKVVESLDEKIAVLEKEMVESQGGDIYRASEALERRRL